MKDKIEKYLNNTLSEDEKKKLDNYFKIHPEVLNEYFSEEEWDQEPNDELEKTEVSENFLQSVFNKDNSHGHRLSRMLLSIAAMLVLGIGIYWFVKHNQPVHIQEFAVNLNNQPKQILNNRTNSVRRLMLADSSVVMLSPGSEITFLRDFNRDKRDVYLIGAAIFKVHKDASRPFTVYSNEISTTALGTEFKISSYSNDEKISVYLLEGKILVKAKEGIACDNKKYYLLPGNEIDFDRHKGTFALSSETAKDILANAGAVAGKHSKPEAVWSSSLKISSNTIQYNQVNLRDVLDDLAKRYHVKIAYPTEGVKSIKFVGTLKKTDPLQKILSDISVMNGFSLKTDTVANTYTLY